MRTSLLCLLLWAGIFSAKAQSDSTEAAWYLQMEEKEPLLRADGYLKELANLNFNNRFTTFNYDNVIHNRINTHWRLSPRLKGEIAFRTRLFNGYTVEENAALYTQFLEQDEGLLDLSWVWLRNDLMLGHTQIDRLYLSYTAPKWTLSLGRQRINWGVSTVWNPNDLFNTYSYLDFDYEERPGADALRFQYFGSVGHGFEVAYRPAERWDESVLGFMAKFNRWNYDFQVLTVHYRSELALGLAWAGNIKGAGFKGEFTYFHPETSFREAGYLVGTLGLDYAFEQGLYLQTEFLYNGNWREGSSILQLLQGTLPANNLFPAQTAWFLNAAYPLHPLWQVGLGSIWSPDERLFFVFPSLTYSAAENLDILLTAQLLFQRELEALTPTTNLLFLRIKWSF